MKRIAYVCADAGVPAFGSKGCSVHVQEVIRAMRRRGCSVDLLAARLDGDPPGDLAEIRVRLLPRATDVDLGLREQIAQRNNAALRTTLSSCGRLDLVYERHSLWSYAAMEAARDAGVATILEVNAPLIDEQRRHRELIDAAGAEQCARRAFAAANAIVAVSEEAANYTLTLGATEGRVHVIPNGVDAQRFAPALRPARDANAPFTIGFVGTMKPWHGLETLTSAFELLVARGRREFRLLLVGDGPHRKELEVWRANLQAGCREQVRLAGAVAPAEVPKLLQEMDAAVLCPPQIDGYYFSPLKLFEYMASGLAVVASRVGQIAEVVEDGVTGLLVLPSDPLELATALEHLAASPDVCGSLGAAARESILRRHTWQAVLDRLACVANCPWDSPCLA